MPRRARVTPGGLVYHVLNRTVAGLPLFRKEKDYEAFERIMVEAQERRPTRLLAWCLMRNHWHFVVWPREEGEITAHFRWLAHTHAMRWHVAHNTVGRGHLYQGRFKCFPVEEDEHFFTVCRYVERNALTAGVVERAEDWRWGSLWARRHGGEQLKAILGDWPIARPTNWIRLVNEPMTEKEAERIRVCIARNRPYGNEAWQGMQAKRLGLWHTMRSEGRPKAFASIYLLRPRFDSGEGLQHQDGNSHLNALAFPNCRAYDPCYAYEMAVIVLEGLHRMFYEEEDCFVSARDKHY